MTITNAKSLQVVWFKRDLRLHDHEPLTRAAARGPTLPLHIVEPDLWQQPDMSGRQFAFLRESLMDLREQLGRIGQPLIIRAGDALTCLDEIHRIHGIETLWSHEETGNGWTFERDLAVLDWCRQQGIAWQEIPQFGVIRRLKNRRGWAGRWDRFMARPAATAPIGLTPLSKVEPGPMPEAHEIGIASDPCPERFRGGRTAGLDELGSFLRDRGEPYQKAMSGPLTAFDGCSRISAHLTFGTVSMRETFQAARRRQAELHELPGDKRGKWPGAIRSFLARLHWHCHFMQKLEDEPEIEFRCFHPAYEGLREENAEAVERWATGQTGLPFVDACMRALNAHGWINFRMRAMLVSFASYHLWLPWRSTGEPLARMFTDYEPGIHWSQMQMQSATTGINLPRIYNPIKQGRDFDKDGAFIRRWVPELQVVPEAYIHEPRLWPEAESALKGRYPQPIVEERVARKLAQEKIWGVRREPGYREIADAIQMKHGSRKSGIPQHERKADTARRKQQAGQGIQLSLLASD
ncbi:MAG: FAD-binding domain-containing protein [Pseudomonadota bacterium]